jgi:signal transduction histidine kinase
MEFIGCQIIEDILSCTSDGIILTDKDLITIYINVAANNYLSLIGNNTTQYIGKYICDIIPQLNLFHSNDENSETKTQVYRNKKIQLNFDLKNSQIVLEISINSSTINNKPSHIFNLRNVTDSLICDIKNKKSHDNFIAYLSHELRNPLQSITLSSYLLQNSLQGEINLSDKSKSQLIAISRACSDMKRIINDVLDLSKIDAKEFQLEYDNHCIKDLLDNLLDVFSDSANDKNIQITTKISDNVPQFIFSDEVRINQILSNLISNAIKYSSGTNSKVIIEVEYNEPCHGIVFKVSDSGMGISQQDMSQLFKQFGKTSNSFKFNIKSNGLGLYLSQKIAHLLGGYITVKSEPKKGSIFSFYHPIKLGSSGIFVNRHNIQMGLVGNILLVDDNESNLALLRMLLESFNYEYSYNLKIESVIDGKDAIDICKENENSYDIIFMDINMNGIDGCTASKILKNNNFKGKIIATTGNIMAKKENRIDNNYDHFDDIIIKPYDDSKILQMLNKYLTKY